MYLKRYKVYSTKKQVIRLAVKTAERFAVSFAKIKIKTEQKQKASLILLSNYILQKFSEQCEKIDDEEPGILLCIK